MGVLPRRSLYHNVNDRHKQKAAPENLGAGECAGIVIGSACRRRDLPALGIGGGRCLARGIIVWGRGGLCPFEAVAEQVCCWFAGGTELIWCNQRGKAWKAWSNSGGFARCWALVSSGSHPQRLALSLPQSQCSGRVGGHHKASSRTYVGRPLIDHPSLALPCPDSSLSLTRSDPSPSLPSGSASVSLLFLRQPAPRPRPSDCRHSIPIPIPIIHPNSIDNIDDDDDPS